MKKFFTILLTISMCISLISCSNVSSSRDTPTKSESEEQKTTKKSIETTTQHPTTTEAPTTTQAPTTTPVPTTEAPTTKAIVSTDLFETVYFPYANREKPFLFEAIKTFAESQSDNYTIEIVEEADQNPTIKFTDENGNCVFFDFSPANDMNVLMLMLVSYFDVSANAEVSLSNLSTDCSRQYDTFNTHTLGGERNTVNNPSEQRKFLFDK